VLCGNLAVKLKKSILFWLHWLPLETSAKRLFVPFFRVAVATANLESHSQKPGLV
jgi:hypothetical protein